MEVFESLLNARVAVVGRSGHLSLKRLGLEIENYDFVVRVNHLSSAEVELDLGTRCDILALNPSLSEIPHFSQLLKKAAGGPHLPRSLLCLKHNFDTGPNGPERYIFKGSTALENMRKISPQIPVAKVEDEDAVMIDCILGGDPTTGASLIAALLISDLPKELGIFGFSFYEQFWPYREADQPRSPRSVRSATHKVKREVHALQELIAQSGVEISGDSVALRVLIDRKYKGPNLAATVIQSCSLVTTAAVRRFTWRGIPNE